jgi:AcrR family transcriptional regulator
VRKAGTRHITEETRVAILDAAWGLIVESGKLDVGQAEIAAKAGVSRQTIYLAFGGRAGLLVAMLRNRDAHSEQVARLMEIAEGPGSAPRDFMAFIEAWLDYLPLIYPVGILLDAAAVNDTEAAAAWDDRLKKSLLFGMRRVLRRVEKAGGLAAGWTADTAAQLAWSLVHPASWRLLVVESGWSADAFRRSRIDIIGRTVFRKSR